MTNKEAKLQRAIVSAMPMLNEVQQMLTKAYYAIPDGQRMGGPLLDSSNLLYKAIKRLERTQQPEEK